MSPEYFQRLYRSVIDPGGLTCREVRLKESDLYVCGEGDISGYALQSLEKHRADLEIYLGKHHDFATSFRPVPATGQAPPVVKEMAEAASLFGVGPMSAVAGAIAQKVGEDLLAISPRLLIENGGDLFIAGGGRWKIGIFAGRDKPPLRISVESGSRGVGVCTSSSTIGPSVSLGIAEAAVVVARTAAIADAAATWLGNMVRSETDVSAVMDTGKDSQHVEGLLLVSGDSIGAWGCVELV